MIRAMRAERGALLVMTAVLVILLLGVSAFALDLGRIYLLRTEMQNAADTAARAGAMELDGQPGALTRSVAAIRNLLSHKSHFGKNRELLEGLDYQPGTPDQSPIVFYSWIGSSEDPVVSDPEDYCETTLAGTWREDRCVTTDYNHAHYVEVRLDPDLVADADAYTVDLFFLPVLGLIVDDVGRVASIRARAVAGRHFFVCNYPPVMFCNPFEPLGETFAEAVDPARPGGPLFERGDSLILRYQAGNWAPGNFAFLLPKDDDGNFQIGARALGEYLANPAQQTCTPPEVHTRTGSVQSWGAWGWNTRFDPNTYRQFDPDDYPPAPNVIEYPQDEAFQTIAGLSDRFGNGIWSAADYWTEFHTYHDSQQPKPTGWDGWTRWEVYNWEISQGFPACDPDGQDNIDGTADDITCPAELTELPVHVEEDQGPFIYRDPWEAPGQPDRDQHYRDPSDPTRDPAVGDDLEVIVDGLPVPHYVDFGGTPVSIPDRRMLFTAVINCEAQNIHGSTDAVADAFAKFFILQAAPQGASADDYVVEYMGLASEQDEEYHVEVQLYE